MPLLGLPGSRMGATRLSKPNVSLLPAGMNVVSVTAHASANTKGSWIDVAPAASATGAQWIMLGIGTNFLAGNRRDVLMDIAHGPGGSEVLLIENMTVGYRRTLVGNDMGAAYWAMIPILQPTGVALRARTQCSTGSVTTAVTAATFSDQFAPGWAPFQRCHTIGADTANSRGTTVTGKTFLNSPTPVSFSPTEDCRAFFLSIGLAGTTGATAQEIVVGVNIAGTGLAVQFPCYVNSDESIVGPLPNAMVPIERFMPAGSTFTVTIYVGSTQADFDVCVHFLS